MVGRKGIDEFVWVLAAGLMVIVIMLYMWGTPSPPPNVTDNVTGTFAIGVFPQDIPRYIRIGDFSVSYAVGSEIIKTEKNVEVRKGLFETKDHKMSVELDRDMSLVTGGFINIRILDTNSRGNFLVKINGNNVFNQKVTVGKIEIPVDKNLIKEYNVIEISCGGAGWKFWATTFYKIDKVEFGINYYGNVIKTEEFQVFNDELEKFKSGEVSFSVNEYKGSGDLMIDINGRRIFKGVPNIEFSRSFDVFDVGLFKGSNVITFSAERGSTYDIRNAQIIIVHQETGRKSRSFSFYVDSSSNVMKGRKGTISFYITNSNYRGSLLVTITDAEGNRHPTEAIQTYSIGEKKIIEFDSSYVKSGYNTVTFEASGDGSFVIGNLEIKP